MDILHLSIPQLMDIWVVYTFWLFWIKLQFVHTYLCEHMLSVLLNIYLGAELLSQMTVMFNFLRNYHRHYSHFHRSFIILYFYKQCPRVQFIHIFINNYCPFKNMLGSYGMWSGSSSQFWCWASLQCLLGIWISSLEKCLIKFFAYFSYICAYTHICTHIYVCMCVYVHQMSSQILCPLYMCMCVYIYIIYMHICACYVPVCAC